MNPKHTPGQCRSDIILTSRRTVRYYRMANDAIAADIVGQDGPEMTESEWEEYCDILVEESRKNRVIKEQSAIRRATVAE